jgi:hypothetical protein
MRTISSGSKTFTDEMTENAHPVQCTEKFKTDSEDTKSGQHSPCLQNAQVTTVSGNAALTSYAIAALREETRSSSTVPLSIRSK